MLINAELREQEKYLPQIAQETLGLTMSEFENFIDNKYKIDISNVIEMVNDNNEKITLSFQIEYYGPGDEDFGQMGVIWYRNLQGRSSVIRCSHPRNLLDDLKEYLNKGFLIINH